MLSREVLPDEAADHLDSAPAELRHLFELVVLVAEDGVDSVGADPVDVFLEGSLEAGGLGDVGLVPDACPFEGAGHRALLAAGLGEDEGLVTELVDGGAQLAADHRLAAVEPLGDDADAHQPSRIFR